MQSFFLFPCSSRTSPSAHDPSSGPSLVSPTAKPDFCYGAYGSQESESRTCPVFLRLRLGKDPASLPLHSIDSGKSQGCTMERCVLLGATDRTVLPHCPQLLPGSSNHLCSKIDANRSVFPQIRQSLTAFTVLHFLHTIFNIIYLMFL